ncbi:uncharacterized protein TNCV_2620261 [Trichonephila clavipes]|uniref:Uncharacterized protein n=1 Tax=Trichonephila clavipes TaxID=2585209 RepID=A0A8X6WCI6_TRICX|nr:uncharacterized protein TNCV_2620261 [Trichonephila clavipes]
MEQSTVLNVDLWSGREKKKREIGMARKKAENRKGSLGFPGTVVETPLHDEKVTVWVGFTTSTVIGPFFFEEMRDSGFVTATRDGSFGDDRVLSRHFPHAWPPRSPDLSPCDYWLWGYLKSQVYRDRPTSLGMLKDNILLQCLTQNSGHALQCCSQHYS